MFSGFSGLKGLEDANFATVFIYNTLGAGLILGLFKRNFLLTKLDPGELSERIIENNDKVEQALKLQQSNIHEVVNELFNSVNFKRAVLERIPSGETKSNEEYVKFLLVSLEDKKMALSKSMSFFLKLGAFLTLLAAGVVLYFGFSLLQLDSVGFNQTLKQVKALTSELPELMAEQSRLNEQIMRSQFESEIENFKKDGLPFYIPSFIKVDSSVEHLIRQGEIMKLEKLAEGNDRDKEKHDKVNAFIRDLKSAQIELSKNELRLKQLDTEFPTKIELLSQKVDKINADNYLSEFIKRVSISLIVVTFFILLIRFCISQYKLNYQEVIQADSDSLLIRKVYVALQRTQDTEILKGVFESFLRQSRVKIDTAVGKSLDVNELIRSFTELLKEKK